MALQVNNVVLNNGMSAETSYARIDSIGGSKDGLTFSLNYYLDQQSFIEGKEYLKSEQHTFVPSVADDAQNFIKQGYNYLKSLPDFADAIDVLEE